MPLGGSSACVSSIPLLGSVNNNSSIQKLETSSKSATELTTPINHSQSPQPASVTNTPTPTTQSKPWTADHNNTTPTMDPTPIPTTSDTATTPPNNPSDHNATTTSKTRRRRQVNPAPPTITQQTSTSINTSHHPNMTTQLARHPSVQTRMQNPSCNPNLRYWTSREMSNAGGLAWIPWIGPGIEGGITDGIMEHQNTIVCQLRELANTTTKALQLFLRATTELRTYSILNRHAIDFLLQRWGGTCRILGPNCCIEPHDWSANITAEINHIREDILNHHEIQPSQDPSFWAGWQQWVPTGASALGIILAILALICLCRITR
nr:GP2 [Cuevavirus lloviuense]WJL97492.1 GP2 [Cuevavirus lloviuense]